MGDDLSLLAAATWVLVGIVCLVMTAVLGACWWVIVWPVVVEVRRARRAGDPWAPFLRREDGSWGPLTANRWWAGFRAEDRGGSGGLVVRWGFWLVQAVLLTFAVASGIGGMLRLALLLA